MKFSFAVVVARLLNISTRIIVAAAVGIIYENYWFDRKHLLGHLYYLNYFRIRGEQVEDRYQKMVNETYPFHVQVVLNLMTASGLYYILVHRQFFRPKRVFDILVWTLEMTFIFIFVQQPTRFILDIYWQVFGHHVCHNIFILFAMTSILMVKFKWRKES